jgi:hypothetical protein
MVRNRINQQQKGEVKMAQIELTDVDIQNLLAIINTAQIKGQDAETIANLKIKLRQGQPPAPEVPDTQKEGGE